MALRPALRVLGILLLLLSLSMSISIFFNLYQLYGEGDLSQKKSLEANLLAFCVGIFLSSILIFVGKKDYDLVGKRESFFIVTFAWFLGGFVGALPFYFWAHFSGLEDHPFLEFINCYFETVSGLTTTGGSILSNIPLLPKGLLFWRSFTQWLGGLGIVVLFVAIMPLIAKANKSIFLAEKSNMGKSQDTPSLKDMAQIVWIIYTALTVLQIILMKFSDSELSWFTCLTFAFATTPTSGLSIFNESAGSLKISTQWIVILFMFLSAMNYALFYDLLRGKWRSVLRNTELRFYILIVFIASLIIAVSLKGHSYSDMQSNLIKDHTYFRIVLDAVFQVLAFQTTTGLTNVNSDQWPDMAKYILVLLMFIGGCSGSTAGGIKVVRVVALFKLLIIELERTFRPNVVRPCIIDESQLNSQQKYSILIHIHMIILLICFGTFCLFFFECGKIDMMSAFSASLSCFSNVGPGFSLVGATGNYGFLSTGSKTVLSFLMVLGRLEIFTVLALFSKRFWQF